MSKLNIINVSKIYEDGNNSVKNISIDVNENEFLVLVGPSGCGKSSTLRMIAGLEDITSGQITINGTVINDIEAKNRDIAMVFQNYALYPHMNVFDNMAFSLKLKNLPKKEIKNRVYEVANSLQINDILNKKPSKLSGGQQQRVALGRAIIRKPKIFLMDEPLSNLDAKLRLDMRMEIIKLHKKLNTTFIYVTHDQVEAMTMGERIAIMNEGKIMQIDTPKEIYENPSNLFVAKFIGTPNINVLNAEFIDNKIIINEENIKFELNKLINLNIKNSSKIKIAFRPEDIEVVEDNYDIISNIDVIENLGAEKYIYLKNKIVLKLSNISNLKIDDLIKVKINKDKILIFDNNTGKRL